MFQRLLVPYDFSTGSEHALALAIRLARESGGSILLLNVGTVPAAALGADALGVSQMVLDLNDRIAEERRVSLDRAARAAIPADVQWQARVREGFPPEVILEEAHEHDLIVMGTHGRTGIERVVLGSVTERVLRGATVPVLVTR